jgi:hypothetical protein
MKYLRKIYESNDLVKKSIIDLKSLPYKDFVTQLSLKIKTPEFINMVNSLEKDPTLSEDYGQVTLKSIQAEKLVPTQSQIGLMETMSWMSNPKAIKEIIVNGQANLFDNNRILVANNKWILDGHHRWSFVHMLNPSAIIPCININLPGKKPVEILKDVQMTIAATYKDLYTRQTPIQMNISRMPDKDILPIIMKYLTNEEVLLLRESYGAKDFSKMILKEFILPDFLYEQRAIRANDYVERDLQTRIEVDPEIKELDETDNDNPDKQKLEADIESGATENLQTGLDFAGILDPTGIIDVLNGIGYLYRGEYMLAIACFVAAVPLGDIVAKPVIAILKNQAFKKFTQALGKALKNFDAKKAAQIFMDLEKSAPNVGKFLEFITSSIDIVIQKMGQILEKIGQNWIKLKILYSLFSGKIKRFFEDIFSWREKLKKYLTTSTESEVYGILATNLVKIKRLIVDKQVDKMNMNFSIGIHPVQTALKAKIDPYKKGFRGVPTDLLANLPKVITKLPMVAEIDLDVEEEEKKDKETKGLVKDFKKFSDKTKKGKTISSGEDVSKVEPPKKTEIRDRSLK